LWLFIHFFRFLVFDKLFFPYRCAITLIHVPSIYPPAGEAWNWTHGILNFYIDDDNVNNLNEHNVSGSSATTTTITMPSISITLLELAGESNFNKASSDPQLRNTDGGPWGIDMMGRTAHTGGVYSTVPIPFQTSLRTSIQAPDSAIGQSVYWFMIRGVEGHGGVLLGGGGMGHALELPRSARLRVTRIPATVLEPYEFLTLASRPNHTSGALVRVTVDASGPDFSYLEACLRLLVGGDAVTPIFLSSGTEDYFLSASYFDAGKCRKRG
jgi:hypothetical protein